MIFIEFEGSFQSGSCSFFIPTKKYVKIFAKVVKKVFKQIKIFLLKYRNM